MLRSTRTPVVAWVAPFRAERSRWLMALALICSLLAACSARLQGPPPLRLSAAQGAVRNELFRQGPSAAHLVLTSGLAPRLVVAFPAGNSGTALWFEARSALAWQPQVALEAARHRAWHGVRAELTATTGPVRIRQAILSSVRLIRDYQQTGAVPAEVLTQPHVSRREIVWQRRRLDGAPGYRLTLRVLRGAVTQSTSDGALVLTPGVDGRLHLRVTALTADRPLTPIDAAQVLTAGARPDAQLRRTLAFLSYREKLLAGSWRFNTYFGRDTLMTSLLLAPVLQPHVMEAALRAVLERLNASGEVAHEEDVGEYAVLQRMRAGEPASDAPLFDYSMVDDDFMLALVAARHLLQTPAAAARGSAFLARATSSGERYGAMLARNLRFIVESAAPFAREPRWERLIALKPGARAGNWRDSEEGLGGGRYPYDVNGVLVPAALQAAARLGDSNVMRAYLDEPTRRALASAAAMAEVWRREASALFDVVVPAQVAHSNVAAYAGSIGVDAEPALRALGTEAIRFRAVALDAEGRPVPILNSDEALSLLLDEPAPEEVLRIVQTLLRPFPAGLMTEAGLLVANPAYAAPALAARFDRSRYHGTVIWSWQQALLAAGLRRQLARAQFAPAVRASLTQAHASLQATIAASGAAPGAELWSWSVQGGRYHVQPFGQRATDETESNAVQLWSTIYLAQ
jgi:hypothetical protein